MREKIFSSENKFQLYSIMVRKQDFISYERLLQSFPYILLEEHWIEKLRKKTLSLAERAHYYFKDTLVDNTIRSWQKKIIKYLEEQKRLPFPLFRLYQDWTRFYDGRRFLSFQSARGEKFQLPLHLSGDIAYLSGVIMGDGHLAEYFINIIDASKEHIENLAKLLQELFHSKIEIFKQPNANAWNVNILGKWIVRFFNFLSSQSINARKYSALREPTLFSLVNKNLLLTAFWCGIMDADGGYKNTISFTSASKQLTEDFSSFLKQYCINYHLYQSKNKNIEAYQLNITGNSREKFAQLISTKHPDKKRELEQLLVRKIRKFSPRAKTLLAQGSWLGQVQDFDLKKQQEGFFDFSLLPQFSISGIGDYIKNLRKTPNHTQKALAALLSISSSLLSKYERNVTSIPIPLFIQLNTIYNQSFVNYLSNNNEIYLHSRSAKCKFDTKPNSVMLHLLKGLQLKSGNYFLVVGVKGILLEEYKQNLCNYFSIQQPTNRVMNNSVLSEFVRTFCILK